MDGTPTRASLRVDLEMIRNKDRLSRADYAAMAAIEREIETLPPDPKPTYAELLGTPERFRAWLRRQRPERRFPPAHMDECPLAAFLTEESGRVTQVTVDSYKAPAEGPPYAPASFGHLPAWARRLDRALLDAIAPGRLDELSPAECLAILRKVEVGE